MSLGMELRQRQQLTMTPQLQQALRLLQLSSQEFNQEMEAALSDNPFLEEAETPAPVVVDVEINPESAAVRALDENMDSIDAPSVFEQSLADTPPEAVPKDVAVAVDEMASDAEGDEARTDWNGATSGANRSQDDGDWTDWSEAPVSLHEHLRTQLLLWPLSDRDRILTTLIIDELSDAGYLETPLEELLETLEGNDVEAHELESALKIVQQLEPAGIGARNLQECLLLQLAELAEDTPALGIARELVEKHFDLLAKRQFPRLGQLLGCDETMLHTARALIRTLDPRPGRCYAADDARYIVPDILVVQSGKRWVAKMNPAVQPAIRLNSGYAELAGGRGGSSSCGRMLQEARWLLRNIAQRFDTIQRVADAIVARQKVFFSYGEAAMKPMSLKDIAAEVGLHESTVCRVSNGKYMATPRGLFEFKYFFSRQMDTEDGSCSATAIRALIKELIAAENPENPLSDVQLAKLLSEQGFKLVRRTVTKYRNQMRVPSVELRRVSGRQPIAA